MNYPTKDFHGMTVDESVTAFHRFITKYLLAEEETWCELITGQGPVQCSILEEVQGLGLEYNISAANLGRILVLA